MTKKAILVRLCSLLVAPSSAVAAQQPGKISQIGILEARGPSDRPQVLAAFRQGLRDFGYIEGKNIVLIYRYAEGNNQHLPRLAEDLVRLKVDIIVASDSQPAVVARTITSTIPIVMIAGRDPVEAGLAVSLARPGRNVTGLTSLAPELLGKRLELLKEAAPRTSRVAVLVETTGGGRTTTLIKEMEKPAQRLGMQLKAIEVRNPSPDFAQALRSMAENRLEALVIGPMPALVPHMRQVVELSSKSRLPAMAGSLSWVNAGILMSYGANTEALSRRAATYVEKILNGKNPGDLPFEQPTKFELAINLKTAKRMGMTIPPNLLARADKVIK